MRKITRYILFLCSILITAISLQSVTYLDSYAQSSQYPREASKKSNFYDGPYLIYHNDYALILTSEESVGKMILKSKKIKRSDLNEIFVYKSGFIPRRFKVRLKPQIMPAPNSYPEPEKIFVLSDIEGNFNTFINLLQQHGIIDAQLDWQFGKGHLVINGDVFDRGNHVTELLWLIYKLEDDAKDHGGMVHFILGNHETMNLAGDIRYVENKYRMFAELSEREEGLTYTSLFSPDSELGRWLRSKNAVEKIGNKIFVHGGISPELAQAALSLYSINHYVITAVDKKKDDYTKIEELIMGRNGPLWYRGYFRSNEKNIPITDQKLDEILNQYGAKYIIVGHTVVKKPELIYGGRICAIDVVPPKDHLITVPPLCAYGIFIQHEHFFLADENGLLKEM